MAGDTFKFVDSVSSTATVRLDINDQAIWAVTGWDAPPPQLRRIAVNNSLTDGGTVAASQYEMRTLAITLELVTADQDTNATQIQNLARELDRPWNFLRYQPVGATNAVYFKTYRSDISELKDYVGAKAIRSLTINLLADPFAIGERVDAVAANVHLDFLQANPLACTTPTILGDVPVRPVIQWANSNAVDGSNGWDCIIAVEPATNNQILYQAESAAVLGADTSVMPNSAFYTGSGSNYTQTTFSTNAGMASRLSFSPTNGTITPGEYRIVGRFLKGTNSDTITVQARYAGRSTTTVGETVTVPSGFQILDLGTFTLPLGQVDHYTMSSTGMTTRVWEIDIYAQRVSGTGVLNIDYIALVPASYYTALVSGTQPPATVSDIVVVFDGEQDAVYSMFTGTLPGGIYGSADITDYRHTYAGSLPYLIPGQAWRVWFVNTTNTAGSGCTDLIYVGYFPRYLHVRPLST